MASDKPILRTHANEIFAFITQFGLNPSEFEWALLPSRWSFTRNVSTLIHRPTGHYYKFDYADGGGHAAEFSPGLDRAVESADSDDWDTQRALARHWVACLKRELDAPDLWGRLAGERALITAPTDSAPNEKFSRGEINRVTASLVEIREYARSSLSLSDEQARVVEARLEYLQAASERMGRKDWMVLALGVLTNIVISAAFTPSAAQEFFRFAGQVLQWVLENQALLH